jgi:S1-C subfamily serine protease
MWNETNHMPIFRRALLALVCPVTMMFQPFAAQIPSDASRAETLRALDTETARELESAARRKTAIVLQGQWVNPFATTNDMINVVIKGQAGSHLGAAMAAAIDRRGYFLTAAHVADDEPLSLVFFDGKQLRASPARVVAKLSNNHKQAKLDIAILHVDAELGEVFQWADLSNLHRSDPLMEIGRAKILDQSKPGGVVINGIVGPVAFAGKFKKTINLRGGGIAIRTEMPVRAGDSGGPVLALDGKLLGIACGSVEPLLGRDFVVANRPDLKWLNDLMNDDSGPHPQMMATHENTDSGDPITITVPLLSVTRRAQ